MSEEEAQAYDSSYRRAKTVLNKINQYARQKYLSLLRSEENMLQLDSPNYAASIAAHMAQRAIWNELQELTRTT